MLFSIANIFMHGKDMYVTVHQQDIQLAIKNGFNLVYFKTQNIFAAKCKLVFYDTPFAFIKVEGDQIFLHPNG